MSPLREALVLPCLFLTVGLLGGLRVGAGVRLQPPPLEALVLAVLLLGALVRSGACSPDRLMNPLRTPLENLSGLVVLLTLFAASAQIFNLVTPDTGLLHLLVTVFFFVQLLTTLTAVRDRQAMLRSLVVLFGCAFILRFVALESLYSPGRGLMKRVMTAIMEGITLGALDYTPVGAATGYLAFFALALYLIGLLLVGSRAAPADASGLPVVRPGAGSLVTPALLLVFLGGCTPGVEDPPRAAAGEDVLATSAEREHALAKARVWEPPQVPIAEASLGGNPVGPGAPPSSDEVSCRFVPQAVGGTTWKFYCELSPGDIVKVKYGRRNPELVSEVAATRLLSALGFGADAMYRVARVRCFGCPAFPFQALRCHSRTGFAKACFLGGGNYERSVVFEPAILERRIEGRRVETVESQGWAWYELDRIDPEQGGSPRAHLDAFRLMAVILAHWDNKGDNQRLICTGANAGCSRSLALMQDLGATFGPNKLDLVNWKRVRVWQDPRACRVSMKQLPFGGATFPDAQISEDGRLFLLEMLERLSAAQLRELFAGAGVTDFDGVAGEGRDPGAWAETFLDKVRQVRQAGPCPVR